MRAVHLELASGPYPLAQSDITSITVPGGPTLQSSAASFNTAADGGAWAWTVTTGTNDGTADYISTGTVTITP